MSDLAGLLNAEGASLEAEDDFEQINKLYLERGFPAGASTVTVVGAESPRSVTRALRRIDGQLAKSVKEFQRSGSN